MPRKKLVKEEPTQEVEHKPAKRAASKPRARAAKAPVVEASAPAAPTRAAKPAKTEKKPLFGGRSRAAAAPAQVELPEMTAPDPEAIVEPAKGEKPKRAPARRKSSEPKVAAVSYEALGDDLPIPVWRSKQEREAAPRKGDSENEPRLAPRRSRGRKNETEPITAAAAMEVTEPKRPVRERRGRARTEPEPVPQAAVPELPPFQPIIPTPKDAPQVVLRDGVPSLVRDGRVYPPLFFFGSSQDERRAATVLDEMRMASEAGIHLHSHLVDFEVDPRAVDASVEFAAYMLAQSLKVDPEAQVLFRVVFVAPKGWQDKYPRGSYTTAEGFLAEPSVSDDEFWGVASDCLALFVKKLRLLKQNKSILGVHLERGEWFLAGSWGYDTSQAARGRFRDWARSRYHDDIVGLRAAWFSGDASFDKLEIPPFRDGDDDQFIRASRKGRKWVDYHLFLSDVTVQRIGELAYEVKKASEGSFLVGASYGYTFEWSHPASGHLSLGKLLRTPEIDFIAGPPSYKNRGPGGAAAFPCPVDSVALNGKLYISEEDFKTSIAQAQEPDDFNPMIKTPQALESIHWRGAGSALAHAAGACWIDLWGNGWLKTASIWERGERVNETLIHRMAAPVSAPDVALFVDERALAYLVDEKAFALLVQNVREAVLRSGLSVGFYLLSDLAHRERFPESKLYIFLNAWDIRSELRAAIKSRLQRDDKVLFWLYAAGLFDSGRESLERAREVTGIALKPQPFHSKSGTTILNRRHPLCEAFPDKGLTGIVQLEPSYFAIPEEATILGEYSQTGLPSFVVREFQGEPDPENRWTSVFLGEPVVTPALVRALGQMAGAHVWNYQDDVVHARPPFLSVHCTGTGPRTIPLPGKWAAYDLLTQDWVTAESSNLRFSGSDGSTHLFLVGVREELEAILARDPSELLTMAELPPQPDNTTRFDIDAFEVPMMKLGEWMEGMADEGDVDDLLLRPQLAVEEPEEAEERPGRRRRRRGGRRGDRNGGEEGAERHRENAPVAMIDDDLGMGVTFRKRG